MKLKDGDIYFWRWKDPESRFGDPYHCWSGKAVVIKNNLHDIFWGFDDNKNRLTVAEVNIDFKGNIHEMTTITEWNIHYYRPEDIVDMRHSNSPKSPIYLKKGTEKNQEVMRERVQYKIEKSEREIESAKWRIELLNKDAANIDAGRLDEVCL